jgi:hypothetical protein
VAQNEAPDVDAFCIETNVPESSPAIRFIGGIALEPQVDPTKGTPSSCGLTLDMIAPLQAALAPFQPFLTLLDAVASLAQCFLLMGEVITNPFKIPDLLGCIPGLIGKINTLLQLIPIFPQGIQAFVTFIVDVLRFVATQLDCIIEILESIQALFDQLAVIANRINNTDDAEVQAGLRTLFECSEEEANSQASQALSALGPIARLLCSVRAILALLPGGAEVQKQLAIGDPSNIEALDDAINGLKLVRDALFAVEDVLIGLTAGLGVLPPLEIGFSCPLDDISDEEEEEEEIPVPSITSTKNVSGGLIPPGTITQAADENDPDFTLVIVGTNYSGNSKVFWDTAPISDVTFTDETELRVEVPAGLRINTGLFQLAVVNEASGGGGPFSGLDGSGVGGSDNSGEGVEVSNQFQVEVA